MGVVTAQWLEAGQEITCNYGYSSACSSKQLHVIVVVIHSTNPTKLVLSSEVPQSQALAVENRNSAKMYSGGLFSD